MATEVPFIGKWMLQTQFHIEERGPQIQKIKK